MENFYLFMDRYQNQDINDMTNEEWEALSTSTQSRNKHLQKIIESANVINDINADVFILTEVGGADSLNNFNKYFLNNQYDVVLREGNSSRGIEIGFLINKKLKMKSKIYSNKKILLDNGKKFSRSIAELQLSNKEGVQLVLLGVHLKSKHHQEKDFEGIEQRTLELSSLKKHVNLVKEKYNVPVIIGGDFNCSRADYEFNDFADSFFEFHELKGSTPEEACTYVYFKNNKVLFQLDYLFCTDKNVINLKDSYTYRFKNEYGDNLGIPDTFSEKKMMPSDHFPVVLNIDLTEKDK
jgi:endonuclease/exonuclease/phosphatase family metal-dependent hydrolase